MEHLNFDDPDLKNNLIGDGIDFVSDVVGDYDGQAKVLKSGKSKLAIFLLIIGLSFLIIGLLVEKKFSLISNFITILIGYYVYSSKNNEKTAHKYHKVSRIIGIVLFVVSFLIILLFNYKII